LPVMGVIKRRGTLLLLVVLPDGSRSLIPASWSDWEATADDASESQLQRPDLRLAFPLDLLRARAIVAALLGRHCHVN
jgi:hypothetical protein